MAYTVSKKAHAERKAAAKAAGKKAKTAAEARGGKKVFRTISIEVTALELIRAYMADPVHACTTLSDAIRARFGKNAQ